MSSLFGGGAAKGGQRGQQKYAKKQQDDISEGINESAREAGGLLMGERANLKAKPVVSPFKSNIPGYNLSTGMKNGVAFGNMSRTGETQGFMDRLLAGLGSDENSYRDLLSQIRPGFGRLSEANQSMIKNQYAERYGNLRDQLAKRRVLGASFADAELERNNLERDQQMRLAMGESMVQELKMTGDVLKAQTDSRNNAISTAFSQLQFEGNMGINLTNMVMTSMNNNLEAQQDLIKLAASIKMQGALGAGNIKGSLAGQVAGSFPQFAELQAQEDAGPMNFLGTVLGAGATAYAGSK
jgi:hypothetical protein